MVASFKDKFGALRKIATFRAQNGKLNLRIKPRHPLVHERPLLLAVSTGINQNRAVCYDWLARHLFNP